MFAPASESLYSNLVGVVEFNTQPSNTTNDCLNESSSSGTIPVDTDETKNTKNSSTETEIDSDKKDKVNLLPFTFDFNSANMNAMPPSFDPNSGGFVKTTIPTTDNTKTEEGKQSKTQLISQIIDASGGVCKVDKVADFIALTKSDDLTFNTRSLLLTMMLSSRPLIQEAFISQGGLSILDSWLNEENIKLIPLILKLLIRLPVDWQALKDNGKIGKTVKKLSAHSDKKIKKQAKQLLKLWMKLVSRATKKPSSNKRKELTGMTEPVRKKPKFAASSAFSRNTDVASNTTELKIVKRNPVVTKDNPSNKVKPTNQKQTYQPLVRLTKPTIQPIYEKDSPSIQNSTDSLHQSNDSLGNSNESESESLQSPVKEQDASPKRNKPLSSCLRDPQKTKKSRSISWAPDNALVRVKLFPRDHSLAVDNPMQMIKARLAAQSQVVQPEISLMRPSIRWRSPPMINLPSTISIAMGEQSTEVSAQQERQRTVLKVNYPDARHIPASPADDSSRVTPLRDSDIPAIPLHDTMKESAPTGNVAASYGQQNNYNSPPAYSNPTTTFGSHSPNQQDILNALASGKISAEMVQSIMSNPTPQNIDILRQMLAPAQTAPPSYPPQPSYQQPTYPSAPTYPPQGYQGYGRTESYYPPGGRY